MRLNAISARGVEIVVREWGEEDATPVVFWHGLNPFGALQLNEAGPAWAERGFRVVAPSAPGLGESPTFPDLDDYRPTRLADLVVEITRSIGLGRFAYVGWSWGASIGVHLASRHADAVTALALLDAGHTDAQDMPGWADATLDERIAEFEDQQVTYPSWDALFAACRERFPAWRPALEQRIRAGMRDAGGVVVARSDPRAGAAAIHGLAAEPPSSALATLGRLELPVLLVLASRNDTSPQVERFQSSVPRAAVSRVESEHDLLADVADETIAIVGDWLVEHRQPRVA